MSSPATIPRTYMSASPIIDLTRRTPDIIIINSESEDEINDPSHNHNNNSSSSNTNYNLRNGLGNNGSSSRRNASRPRRTQSRTSTINSFGLVNLNLMFRHHSAFHPYASTEVLIASNYGNNNSSGSTLSDSTRANTNINSNDVQMINSSPRRRTNNSPKPTTPAILPGHARDLNESHTLICAECDELLHEKLWALSSCGHVVCGSCVDKYKYSEKKKFPCPSCKKTVNSKNILPLYV